MTKQKKPYKKPSKPSNEAERLEALRSYELLDTLPETVLDFITQAASDFCGTEISLISLVDESRQWFKSSVGLEASETPRDISFCGHAILQPDELFEVEDTKLDPRFANNPLVTDNPNIRFYAGMPLTTSKGHSLGTLCVIDSKPKKLSSSQKEGLKHLSNAIIELFDQRLNTSLTPLGRAIEETLNNGIIITDANKADNPITYCNKGFEVLCGYSHDEVIGRNCRFLQGEDTDPEELDKFRKAISNAQEYHGTIKNYRKDGSSFWNEVRVTPVFNNEGRVTHFYGIQQDVTKQRAAEERLLGFSAVLEESLNEIYIFEVDTLKFIQVNHGARNNLGYSMEELTSMKAVDIKPAYTEESFREIIKPLLNGEKPKIQFDTVHRRKDETDYLVEVHLQKMQFNDHPVFVSSIIDITERIQNKLDLKQANTFLDSAPDATVIVDASGNIKISNQQMVELMGYSHDELLTMNVDTFVPQRYRHNHADHRANFISNAKVRNMGTGLDLTAMTKDGREIPIEVSLSPIETPQGTLVAAAIRDTSARKAVEEELRIAKQEAEDATAAKTRFLATASHDLRQPLQALRLYLSALSSKVEDPKKKLISEKMDLSLDTMSELLDALLDISTLESGSVTAEKKDVNLAEILNRIATDSAPQAERKDLKFECENLDYVVHTDPALLSRVISNFTSNAIKYTEQGKVAITGKLNKNSITVKVTDTGEGIPKHKIDSVFDEFVQLDNAVRSSSKGLGLGLSIVKHISRILEHPTSVESTIGEGSSFSVEIPLSTSQQSAEKLQQVSTPSIDLDYNPTILIVDDESAIIDAMHEVLTMMDIDVATAGDGFEALAHIQEGLEPDFVLSDYRMPEMTGVELLTKIRNATRPDLPIAIMTGDTSLEEIKAANLDNCTIMQKPVKIDQLLALINSAK